MCHSRIGPGARHPAPRGADQNPPCNSSTGPRRSWARWQAGPGAPPDLSAVPGRGRGRVSRSVTSYTGPEGGRSSARQAPGRLPDRRLAATAEDPGVGAEGTERAREGGHGPGPGPVGVDIASRPTPPDSCVRTSLPRRRDGPSCGRRTPSPAEGRMRAGQQEGTTSGRAAGSSSVSSAYAVAYDSSPGLSAHARTRRDRSRHPGPAIT